MAVPDNHYPPNKPTELGEVAGSQPLIPLHRLLSPQGDEFERDLMSNTFMLYFF